MALISETRYSAFPYWHLSDLISFTYIIYGNKLNFAESLLADVDTRKPVVD